MIRIFSDPFLLDFIKVAIKMPGDEREQLEAFSGHKFDIDGASIGNYMVPGPKWVIKIDNEPLCVGGFKQQRPGVWRDYMLTTPQAWEKQYWFTVTRTCRRALDSMFKSKQAHRIECVVPRSRIILRPELKSWYGVMGYKFEGIREGYCADGSDAMAFARVEHGHG